ncbi:MAG TPA: hypothetical protein VKB17_08955 [Thermoleophilaceae bacterium]|nr:hypothetical protein [Thermoleophilaceae bacterium]
MKVAYPFELLEGDVVDKALMAAQKVRPDDAVRRAMEQQGRNGQVLALVSPASRTRGNSRVTKTP